MIESTCTKVCTGDSEYFEIFVFFLKIGETFVGVDRIYDES